MSIFEILVWTAPLLIGALGIRRTHWGLVALAALDVAALVADDAAAFAAAVERLANEPALADRLRAGGRAALARHHSPGAIAARLCEVYAAAAAGARRA